MRKNEKKSILTNEELGACAAIAKFLLYPQAAAAVVVTITIIFISPESLVAGGGDDQACSPH